MAVADVSTNTWQGMRRVPLSEMLNTQEVIEIVCCFPYAHHVCYLWELMCLSIHVSFDTLSSDDDEEEDDDDYDDDDESDDESYFCF